MKVYRLWTECENWWDNAAIIVAAESEEQARVIADENDGYSVNWLLSGVKCEQVDLSTPQVIYYKGPE